MFSHCKLSFTQQSCVPTEDSTLRHFSCRCMYGYSLFASNFDSMNTSTTTITIQQLKQCIQFIWRDLVAVCFHIWFLHTRTLCAMFDIFHVLICDAYHGMNSLFSLFLFSLKSFDFSPPLTDFSPVIYAKRALVSPGWSWKTTWTDLMCKYCKKQWVKNAEVCEITNRTEWKSC